MEDAATAEISRSQIWQWIRHPEGKLDDGRKVTTDMIRTMIPEELEVIRKEHGAAYHEERARFRPPSCSSRWSPPTRLRNS